MASDPKLVHVKVYVSGAISAKIQQVWDVVRNYGQAEAWLTGSQGIKTFTKLLPGQVNCQIGAVRLVTIGQNSFVDQLDALDDDRHVMKYKLISHPLNSNPFPGSFLNYRATIRMHEISRNGATFMEWTGEFDTEPQDCQEMRLAIHDRIEAGFQGLELLFAQQRPLQHTTSGRGLPGGGRIGGQDLAELMRGVGSMHIRPANSVPAPGLGMPTTRSPRAGPGSVASEMAYTTQQRGFHESGSGSSLASSPHMHDASHRPGSGHMLHNWTSGGSGSTVNISSLPMRVSGEEAQLFAEGGAGRRGGRSRSLKEGGPYPVGGVHNEVPLPQGFQSQVQQRQANFQSGSADQFQRPEGSQSRRGSHHQHPQEVLGREAPAANSPRTAQVDPLLQEREEFKAAMLAQRFQHMMAKPTPDLGPQVILPQVSQSEPDWSRVAPVFDDMSARSATSSQVTTPFASMGVPATEDEAEWARLMQQREDDLREAHIRRSRSPGPPARTPIYGTAGPFGAAANGPPPHQAGPFGAVAGNAQRGVPRSNSHQSISSLSHGASGALDRSAGSTFSQPADEGNRHTSNRGAMEGSAWASQ